MPVHSRQKELSRESSSGMPVSSTKFEVSISICQLLNQPEQLLDMVQTGLRGLWDFFSNPRFIPFPSHLSAMAGLT